MATSIARLKELHESVDFCNFDYNDEIDAALNVPQSVKDAWRAFTETKKVFAAELKKIDINL